MKTSDALQVGMILACGMVMTRAGRALHLPRQSLNHWDLERLLGEGLSIVGVVIVSAWLLALVIAVVAELLRRRGWMVAARLATRCTPAVMRRVAAALLGIHLVAIPAVAQAATPGPGGRSGSFVTRSVVNDDTARAAPDEDSATHRPDRSVGNSAGASTSPYWAAPQVDTIMLGQAVVQEEEPIRSATLPPVSPAWEPAPLPADGGPMLRAETRTIVDAADVVVAPGDSLWSIVAAQLGPFATAADVADAWPAWYDANRATIGADPSLLLPGQVLHPPSP